MRPNPVLRSVELFAGAGGLALGASRAGFSHLSILEVNPLACETLKKNKELLTVVGDDAITCANVEDFPSESFSGKVDLLTAGPPCQPFSAGGSGKGEKDTRNLFPATIKAIATIQPKAFLIENVKGLASSKFTNYLEYLRLQLHYPSMRPSALSNWNEQISKLERRHSRDAEPEYVVFMRTLNAADYGVPQKRERLFIVGFRANVIHEWCFPAPTHSKIALLQSKSSKIAPYWQRHQLPMKHRSVAVVPESARRNNAEFEKALARKPWVTVRDSISSLPSPLVSHDVPNHSYILGARRYEGHNGSHADEPSKTIKAGDHGVPGGENSVFFPESEFRYLTLRECARIQSFPDDYVFCGERSTVTKQLGNAVPVKLAEVVARSIREALSA